MLEMMALIQQCAFAVDVQTMSALIQVESNAHPYAIGVVDGHLIRQPSSHEEAIATAHQLDQAG